MDRTKRIVILFITISFTFILGISTYRSFNGDYAHRQSETTTLENNKEENQTVTTDKNLEKENNQDQTKEVSQTEETQQTEKQEENKIQESGNDVKSKTSSTTQDNSSSEGDTIKKESHLESNKENNEEISTPSEIEDPAVEDETITVQIEVIGINETMMNGRLKVEKNSNAYTILKTLATQKNIRISTSGYGSMVYVRGIGDLFEKQHGSGSGWMYEVNDISPNIGAGSYQLKDGDHVVWYYVYSE